MRLELPDGQWAELRDRLSYGQARSIRSVFFAGQEDKSALLDIDIGLIKAYVEAWNVLDVDGNAVPLNEPERAPDDTIQAIGLVALEAWNGKPDPKGIAVPSPTTLRVAQ